ncbi:putative nucleotidyltransferase substrate binding domain-containing protein [Geoglobus acetivorans]|uniref:Putative signal-transduction protein containing cAMP-binding and CBS domains n=1 Tax=Geoglobus acetivorans TaxID=565033 RepID=A0A0A7GJB4_GEOAI|nr:putative signal-transduction protein containing cAMP-binding and CBS domains [Geoglobus acetivorans]
MSKFRKLSDFIRRDPVVIEADRSIKDAAKLMDDEKVSSVVVMKNGKPLAFFTESDLRHAIGKDVNLTAKVVDHAKTRIVTAHPSSTILDGLSKMVTNGVKHLAVIESGRIIGVLTLRDLAYELGPKYIKYTAKIHESKSIEDLAAVMNDFKMELLEETNYYLEYPEIVNPAEFFSEISHVVDTIIIKASAIMNMPAEGYVYAVTGSGGRGEQFLLTDRDTLAIFSDESVVDLLKNFESSLDRTGFPGCDHGYTSDKFNLHHSEIEKTCSEVSRNVESNIVKISLFSDARCLFGESKMLIELKECLSEKLYRNRHVIISSLRYKPALTIFGDVKDEFNYKAGAVAPIEYPVRALAITNGIFDVTNTFQRIRALAQEKLIPSDLADDLEHAYTILMRRKIWLQSQNLKVLKTSQLNPMERQMIKDALRTVKKFQNYAERNFI